LSGERANYRQKMKCKQWTIPPRKGIRKVLRRKKKKRFEVPFVLNFRRRKKTKPLATHKWRKPFKKQVDGAWEAAVRLYQACAEKGEGGRPRGSQKGKDAKCCTVLHNPNINLIKIG